MWKYNYRWGFLSKSFCTEEPWVWGFFCFTNVPRHPSSCVRPPGLFFHSWLWQHHLVWLPFHWACSHTAEPDLIGPHLKSTSSDFFMHHVGQNLNNKNLTNNVDWQFQSCCVDYRWAHSGSSTHICSHCIHRKGGLQRNTTTTDTQRGDRCLNDMRTAVSWTLFLWFTCRTWCLCPLGVAVDAYCQVNRCNVSPGRQGAPLNL